MVIDAFKCDEKNGLPTITSSLWMCSFAFHKNKKEKYAHVPVDAYMDMVARRP